MIEKILKAERSLKTLVERSDEIEEKTGTEIYKAYLEDIEMVVGDAHNSIGLSEEEVNNSYRNLARLYDLDNVMYKKGFTEDWYADALSDIDDLLYELDKEITERYR